MAGYTDLGTYIMKLFDPLIAESKETMKDCQEKYLQELPRKLMSRTSISIGQAEGHVKDLANQLIRINQDLLNQYAISIAKKARNAFKESSHNLAKKDQEIEGLKAQIQSLGQRSNTLEHEKNENLQQFQALRNKITELEQQLSSIHEDYNLQINRLNSEWEQRIQKSQDEWDSYLKLKLAEQEMRTSSKDSEEQEKSQDNNK
jgi:uncharacterized protein YoxC